MHAELARRDAAWQVVLFVTLGLAAMPHFAAANAAHRGVVPQSVAPLCTCSQLGLLLATTQKQRRATCMQSSRAAALHGKTFSL